MMILKNNLQSRSYFRVMFFLSLLLHLLFFYIYSFPLNPTGKSKPTAFSQHKGEKAFAITRISIHTENTPKNLIKNDKNGQIIKKTSSKTVDIVNDITQSKVSSGDTTVLAQYLSDVRNIIVKNKYKNILASKLNLKGPVEVEFTIERPNTLKDIQIRKSSGHNPLDQSALQTLKKVESFPEIPHGLEMAQITINFVVEYQ